MQVDGPVVDTRYGPVQVAVVVADGILVDVVALQLPSGDRESNQISAYAAPRLEEMALAAQSADDRRRLRRHLHLPGLRRLPAGRPGCGRDVMAAGLLEKRRVERVMGTAVSLAVPAGAPPPVLDEVFAWLQWVDRTFSVHRPDSVVSRIREFRPGEAPALVEEVLDRCSELYPATDGWFDAWPDGPEGRVDPSGYVKGWSVDVASTLLAGAGIRDYCLAAGGDVKVAGTGPEGRPWRIGIQHPTVKLAAAAVLQGSPLAVATSGAYERGAHIRGRESARLLSATVAGPRLGTADALATALFAADGEAPWFARFRGYEYLTIGVDGRVRWTPGLGCCLVPPGALS